MSNSLRWKDLTDNSASYIVTVMIVGYFCPLVIITYCYRSIYQLVQVSNFTSCYFILRCIDSFKITFESENLIFPFNPFLMLIIGRSEKMFSCKISRKVKLKFVFWCHNLTKAVDYNSNMKFFLKI